MPSSRLSCNFGACGDGGDERLERVGVDGAARDELRDERDGAAAGDARARAPGSRATSGSTPSQIIFGRL